MAFAVSWKPFVKSKIKAVTTTTITMADTSTVRASLHLMAHACGKRSTCAIGHTLPSCGAYFVGVGGLDWFSPSPRFVFGAHPWRPVTHAEW
jgi:hypothetical protein